VYAGGGNVVSRLPVSMFCAMDWSGPSIILTGVLFGLMHGPQLGGAKRPIALLTFVGIVFSLRSRTGSVFGEFTDGPRIQLDDRAFPGLETHGFTRDAHRQVMRILRAHIRLNKEREEEKEMYVATIEWTEPAWCRWTSATAGGRDSIRIRSKGSCKAIARWCSGEPAIGWRRDGVALAGAEIWC